MPESKAMTEADLVQVINSLEASALTYRDEFMNENEERLRRYNNELYGNEEEGRSQVLSTDVNDLVNSDMTSLVRVFMGSGDIIVFEPTSNSKEDIQEAKDKTAFVNHVIRKRPDSYKIIYDYLLDIEVQKMGVLHYRMDEQTTTEEIPYTGIDEIELNEIKLDLENDSDVEKAELIEKEEYDDDTYDVVFRVKRTSQELSIINIATEDFLISPNAKCVDSAPMVGHITWKSRSELVSDGLSEEEVAKFPSSGNTTDQGNQNAQNNRADGSTMKEIRWRDEGGDLTEDYASWANELVRVVTMYPLIDYDGDGIAERRCIVKISNTILENEPYGHVPYAVASALPEAHKAIGDGRASLALEDQKVKTVVKRQMLDNMYMVGNPRIAASERVDVDDLLDVRLNGIVRVDKGASPANELMPISTQYIGQEALQVIQYLDQAKADRAGTLLASQGLEADNLHKETATRFQGVERANEAKIELVCRNIAETGFRKLFDGVAWTLQQYQDSEKEVLVLGRTLKTNPKSWKYKHNASSVVGLGSGNSQKSAESIVGIIQMQQGLMAQGNPLVDNQKLYNSFDQLTKALDFRNTSDFFNNPEIPTELMMAQLEKVTMALMQSQKMIEQLQQTNPLAEAEMVRAQAKLQEVGARETTERIKAASQEKQKAMELMQKKGQFDAEQQFKYTELEIENGVDVLGQGIPSNPDNQ